ncbi:MAG: hypothetical protein QOH13_930 [Thermoleophilaceae bacterium]|nr:hypothetical protein [Thermoleophilaceae bacterium]
MNTRHSAFRRFGPAGVPAAVRQWDVPSRLVRGPTYARSAAIEQFHAIAWRAVEG